MSCIISTVKNQADTPPSDDQKRRSDIGGLSQWQLICLNFARHRLAVICLYVLGLMYGLAIFAEFFAPYPANHKILTTAYAPPQMIYWTPSHGWHTVLLHRQLDPQTLARTYKRDPDVIVPLGFFVKGESYRLMGVIPMQRHFFGVNMDAFKSATPDSNVSPTFFLLGSDKYGQDILSRILYGARVSLSVGLVAIVMTFVLGVTIGGISGYMGGWVDTVVQRIIEMINAFPKLPLWLAAGAALPQDWPPLHVYFAITIALSLLGWTGLARIVRGKFLSLREEDYAVAARLMGASHSRIIFRHLLPGFTSHIIVALTMSVPGMILGETTLSFLGLGLRPPLVSWGVMLQDCLSMEVVANYPWLMLPAVFIVLVVLSFNFTGDGLRDAADPYSSR